jgi:hypothetical protein
MRKFATRSQIPVPTRPIPDSCKTRTLGFPITSNRQREDRRKSETHPEYQIESQQEEASQLGSQSDGHGEKEDGKVLRST